MLEEIGSADGISEYVEARLAEKNDPFRFVIGFGYRVYKNYDPRAVIMQKACHEALETVGRHYRDDPILKGGSSWSTSHFQMTTSSRISSVPTSTLIRQSR